MLISLIRRTFATGEADVHMVLTPRIELGSSVYQTDIITIILYEDGQVSRTCLQHSSTRYVYRRRILHPAEQRRKGSFPRPSLFYRVTRDTLMARTVGVEPTSTGFGVRRMPGMQYVCWCCFVESNHGILHTKQAEYHYPKAAYVSYSDLYLSLGVFCLNYPLFRKREQPPIGGQSGI